MLSDQKKLSLELYKELALEARQRSLETHSTNRLMLPPLVIGLLVLYGEVEKFLGVEFKNPEAIHWLVWFGCVVISLIWICNMSRLAQLSHWHLETLRECEYKLGLNGHRKIAEMDGKSSISKILRHHALRFIGFGIYFSLLLSFLLKSITFDGAPALLEPIVFHELFIPWVAIINGGVLSALIWYFYFKKSFSLSNKIPIKWQRFAFIITLIVLLLLLIFGMFFWTVITITIMGLLILICYLCCERRPVTSNKTSIERSHIVSTIISLIFSVTVLSLALINLKQDQPDINDCLVRGLGYLANGDYAFAIEDFKTAIALDSNNAGAYFHRGSAYYRKGDFAYAVVDLDKAIALDPQNQRARELRNAAHTELEKSAKQ